MRTASIAVIAGSIVLLFNAGVSAQTDFSWNGHIPAGQALEIVGVNGEIHAVPSASGDAHVTATKSARRSNPADVRVQVVPHAGGVTVCAVYPDVPGEEPNRCVPGANRHMYVRDNDTVVRFEVQVPAGVRFVGHTVNGSVNGDSLGGDAEAHTVNGSVHLTAAGVAVGTTVNGSVNVTMGTADWREPTKYSTVNGSITLNLPQTINAEVDASTVNGSIASDFPITTTEFSRRHLRGQIGGGGQHVTLSTVNGSVRLVKQP